MLVLVTIDMGSIHEEVKEPPQHVTLSVTTFEELSVAIVQSAVEIQKRWHKAGTCNKIFRLDRVTYPHNHRGKVVEPLVHGDHFQAVLQYQKGLYGDDMPEFTAYFLGDVTEYSKRRKNEKRVRETEGDDSLETFAGDLRKALGVKANMDHERYFSTSVVGEFECAFCEEQVGMWPTKPSNMTPAMNHWEGCLLKKQHKEKLPQCIINKIGTHQKKHEQAKEKLKAYHKKLVEKKKQKAAKATK
eukprot:gene12102-3566_t